MNNRSTGRFRHSRGNGLSAVLVAWITAAMILTGCSATESGDPASPTSAHTSAVPAADAPAVLRPDRLTIAAIGVETDLMDLGLEPDGALQVPPGGFPAGWYSGSPVPGELGPAVVAGHVDWNGEPGVFFRLHELVPGDEVSTRRSDGVTAVFRVSRVERYPKAAFPTGQVYGDIDHPGLRLITCGGEFDTTARSYRDNTVVYADLVETRAPAPAPAR